MTGSEASFGVETHKGIQLAIDEANGAGGIGGRPIKLISLDNQSKSDESATAITRLIQQDKVLAVLGEVSSSRTMAMAPIAQRAGIPLLSPAATNPKVTAMGSYIFRICFIDTFQGLIMAKFVMDNLGFKRVAILKDLKNDYSMGLADFFSNYFSTHGGQIVVDQTYTAGDVDFKSQLTAIRAAGPEGIIVPGYYTEVGLIARQARELGIKIPLIGGDAWDSPKLWEIGGDAIVGSYFVNHYSPDDPSPVLKQFASKFTERHGYAPDSSAALGYDAAKVLLHAVATSPNQLPSEIRDQLAKTSGFVGVSGIITMDKDRNPKKSGVMVMVEKERLVFKARIDP